MSRKGLIVLGCLAALVLAGLAAVPLLDSPPGVSADSFRRLRTGMSKAHIESILGRKGDVRAMPGLLVWDSDDLRITVWFDAEERATGGLVVSDAHGVITSEPLHRGFSLLETIRSIIHQ